MHRNVEAVKTLPTKTMIFVGDSGKPAREVARVSRAAGSEANHRVKHPEPVTVRRTDPSASLDQGLSPKPLALEGERREIDLSNDCLRSGSSRSTPLGPVAKILASTDGTAHADNRWTLDQSAAPGGFASRMPCCGRTACRPKPGRAVVGDDLVADAADRCLAEVSSNGLERPSPGVS